MVKIINLFGDQYSGQAGKAGVFAKWKGRQYRRKYVIPANPKTTMQMRVRGFFTKAVEMWHDLSSLQRLVFSYLATGLVMSGFNLLVRRYQKAAIRGVTLPYEPEEGIKQIASASEAGEAAALTADNPFSLPAVPVKIGSLTYTPGGVDDIDMDAYVDLEMGDVRVPSALSFTGGLKETGEAIDEGDKLVISYTSGGRTIDHEVLYTVPALGTSIPANATIGEAYRTEYYPIDIKSVVIQIEDFSALPNGLTQLESLEILNCAYTVADSVVTPTPKIYFDLTQPTAPESKVDYTKYTAIKDAKLEVTKVDTSFITWRRYSDGVGQVPIAQTIEDQSYDWKLSAPEYLDVIRAAQSAELSTEHELVVMPAA